LVASGLTEQRERLLDLIDRVTSTAVTEACPKNRPPEDWDFEALRVVYKDLFRQPLEAKLEELGDATQVARTLFEAAEKLCRRREEVVGVEPLLRVFRHHYLEEIDRAWVDHLSSMEHLRDGIHLRGYGQRDPKQEYKKEGYSMFLEMVARVSANVVTKLFESRIEKDEIEAMEEQAAQKHLAELQQAVARHEGEEELAKKQKEAQKTAPATALRSNDPCPCGSNKKFSECHGAALEE
jgi:preprotein translocase subunit SecA